MALQRIRFIVKYNDITKINELSYKNGEFFRF
nr:MAG TPA: hypothetical protein [Caudoviricetes sp.]